MKAPAVSGYDDLVLRGNTLYTPEGSIPLRRLGKGAFSIAMAAKNLDGKEYALLFSRDGVADKEIMSMVSEQHPDNPHIPSVRRFGSTAERTVWAMPLYRSPLRRAFATRGWDDYLKLKKCASISSGGTGYEKNRVMIDCARAAGVSGPVVEAIEAITDWAANYSQSYRFEFSPRNLATDSSGNLVLLDVLFDPGNFSRKQPR